MRVLWASHSGRVGGAELAMLEGVEALCERGVEVHTVLPANGPLLPHLRAAGAAVSVIPFGWWMSRSSSVGGRLRRARKNAIVVPPIAKLIRSVAPDVVVTNTLTVPSVSVAALRCRVPHVWYVHEFGTADHSLRFDLSERISYQWIRISSALVLANSYAVAGHLQQWLPADRLRVTYYAVERAREMSAGVQAPGSDFNLVLVGVKSPGKRQEDAIRALAHLRAWGVPARLALVGSEVPDYAARLLRLADELEVSEYIEHVPFDPDVARHIAAADVALMCSSREAFGRVTVEAMKLGVPVVGADSGATSELIRDRWNGMLYPEENAVEMADRLATLYRDDALRRRLGENASRWARETFTRARFGASLDEVLRQAVSASAAGGSGA